MYTVRRWPKFVMRRMTVHVGGLTWLFRRVALWDVSLVSGEFVYSGVKRYTVRDNYMILVRASLMIYYEYVEMDNKWSLVSTQK